MAALLSAVGLMTDGMDEAAAQTSSTWTGGAGNGTWSLASNWSTLPTTSGTWSLFFGGTTQTTSANDIGTINLSGLSFTNDGSVGQTATFTLSGSTLALSNSLITTTNASGFAPNGDSIGNRLSLSGSTTVSLGAGHNLTIAGDISGVAATLLKVDSGALYLTGSNSYSGPTYINFGNVRTGSGGASSDSNSYALGTGDVVVGSGGMLSVRNSSTVSNNIWISGTGATVGASGGAPLMGSFGASNQTAVVSGTVTLGDSTSISSWGSSGVTNSKLLLTGPIELGANTLTFTQCVTAGATTSTEVRGGIAGTGSVIVDGTANIFITRASSYTGGTRIASGTLHTSDSGALGSGALAVNGGTLDLSGTALSVGTLSGSSSGLITSLVGGAASLIVNQSADATYAGSITDGAGVVGLTKNGAAALYLTGSNSYSGPTYINFGNVRTGSGGASSDSNNYALGTGDVVVSGGGMLSVRNSSTVSNNIWISGTGATPAPYTGGGPLCGSFGASNQTAVVSGTVTLGGSTSITTWGSSGVTNSKLLLTGPIELGSNTLTFTQCVTAGATTYTEVSGAIAGTGSVIVDGTASVYLNGVNTYSGATTVRSGMLGGHGTIAGAVAVESGATIAPGSLADSTGTLSVGSLQLAAGAFASMQIGGTSVGTFDQIASIANVDFGPTPTGGNLAIDFMTGGFATGDCWQLFSGASFSGHLNSVSATGAYGTLEFTYRGNGEWNATSGLLAAGQSFSFYENSNQAFKGRFTAGQLVVVPEPSAFVIAGAGLFIAGCYHLKRRRRARNSDTRRD
jgi:fibronectin-binding autotransporter adhesin